jgi:thioredoxin-like negative regulator of GroEL
MALTIKAIEDWDATIAESDEKLLVIDCHQEWCGRCATLEPALTKV